MRINAKKNESGFSLIELAIVLFIVALLLGGLLAPLSVRLEQENRNKTQAELDGIREALYGFALAHGRLPCPDCPSTTTAGCGSAIAGDGLEDRTGAVGAQSCATVEGNLPWATLGVQETDAWDHHFDYRVTPSFADDPGLDTVSPPASCTSVTPGVSFALCSEGDIDVKDAVGGNDVATNVPAIVVSFGADGGVMPPPSHASEYENANRDQNFVLQTYSSDPNQPFDDMLVWLSPNVLMNRMVMAGLLP